MSRIVIALDLDDVMTDTEAVLVNECRKKFPDEIRDEDLKSESVENLGEKFKKYIYYKLLDDPEFLTNLPLLPLVREALEIGRIKGCEMHIVTGRFLSPRALSGTLDWIVKNKLAHYFEGVHLRPPSSRTEYFKKDVVRKLNAVYAADDRPGTVLTLATICKVFVVDQHWNNSPPWLITLGWNSNIRRVNSLYEMMKTIP